MTVSQRGRLADIFVTGAVFVQVSRRQCTRPGVDVRRHVTDNRDVCTRV